MSVESAGIYPRTRQHHFNHLIHLLGPTLPYLPSTCCAYIRGVVDRQKKSKKKASTENRQIGVCAVRFFDQGNKGAPSRVDKETQSPP